MNGAYHRVTVSSWKSCEALVVVVCWASLSSVGSGHCLGGTSVPLITSIVHSFAMDLVGQWLVTM